MVSHDMSAADGSAPRSLADRQRRALRRLDDGHAALLDALAGLQESEAFLGSRWSVWEVMQHLLTENFVEALEQIASGEREMLPAFDARDDRIAGDISRLEANYQRFRGLIAGLSEEQLDLPATPYNPGEQLPGLVPARPDRTGVGARRQSCPAGGGDPEVRGGVPLGGSGR